MVVAGRFGFGVFAVGVDLRFCCHDPRGNLAGSALPAFKSSCRKCLFRLLTELDRAGGSVFPVVRVFRFVDPTLLFPLHCAMGHGCHSPRHAEFLVTDRDRLEFHRNGQSVGGIAVDGQDFFFQPLDFIRRRTKKCFSDYW